MNTEPTAEDIEHGPYALIARYDSGAVSHGEVISKLGAWPYTPDGSDEGSFEDVRQGHADGVLSTSDIEEIQTRRDLRSQEQAAG